MSEYYTLLSQKVKSARTSTELHRMEKSCTRIYNAGLLSVGEFRTLDCMIMYRLARLD
jgi:hypothetical protein